jgi:hypothetical protein
MMDIGELVASFVWDGARLGDRAGMRANFFHLEAGGFFASETQSECWAERDLSWIPSRC